MAGGCGGKGEGGEEVEGRSGESEAGAGGSEKGAGGEEGTGCNRPPTGYDFIGCYKVAKEGTWAMIVIHVARVTVELVRGPGADSSSSWLGGKFSNIDDLERYTPPSSHRASAST